MKTKFILTIALWVALCFCMAIILGSCTSFGDDPALNSQLGSHAASNAEHQMMTAAQPTPSFADLAKLKAVNAGGSR